MPIGFAEGYVLTTAGAARRKVGDQLIQVGETDGATSEIATDDGLDQLLLAS